MSFFTATWSFVQFWVEGVVVPAEPGKPHKLVDYCGVRRLQPRLGGYDSSVVIEHDAAKALRDQCFDPSLGLLANRHSRQVSPIELQDRRELVTGLRPDMPTMGKVAQVGPLHCTKRGFPHRRFEQHRDRPQLRVVQDESCVGCRELWNCAHQPTPCFSREDRACRVGEG